MDKTGKKIIIGFSGKKGAGKNICGDLVKEILAPEGYKVFITALADPIKEIAIKWMGVPRDIAYASNDVKNTTLTKWHWEEIPGNEIGFQGGSEYSNAKDKYGYMTVRELLQYIGTDLFRDHMHKDFWCKATLNQINESDCDVAIVTDVRFPNEVQMVQDAGGIIVRVHSIHASNDDKHPSETALNQMDRLTVDGRFVCESIQTDDDTDVAKVTSLTKVLNRGFNYILQNDIRDRDILKYTIDKLLLDFGVEEKAIK